MNIFTDAKTAETRESHENIDYSTLNSYSDVKYTRLITCLVFLISTILSMTSFFARDLMISFNENHHTTWLVFTIISGVLLVTPILLFAYCSKLKWNYNPWVTYGLIGFNAFFITFLSYLILPLLTVGVYNWYWLFVIPITVTILKTMNIIYIKKERLSNWLRWIVIFIFGLIFLVFGLALRHSTLIVGGAWVLIWELGNEIWEMFYIRFIFESSKRSFPYYPFFPVFALIFIVFSLLWWVSFLWIFFRELKNPFRENIH